MDEPDALHAQLKQTINKAHGDKKSLQHPDTAESNLILYAMIIKLRKTNTIYHMLKRSFTLVLLAMGVVLCSFTPLNPVKGKITTVVIDAGHGGHDTGCQYAGVEEKHVALSIAKRLGKKIEQEHKDVKVIYTRNDDTFIELWERPAIGNRNDADVFISIHCNANPKTTVYGTETYVMGLHKSEGNLEVAKRENAVILMENNYEKKYDGFDPNSPEGHIYFSLFQNAYLEQSLSLASKIEDHLGKQKRTSRGVKQAGFLVLWKANMPSILIETGFLSNAQERSFLKGDGGQDSVATAIYHAFRDYKTEFEAAHHKAK